MNPTPFLPAKTGVSLAAGDFPLWAGQRPLRELAAGETARQAIPSADPQPVGMWGGGTAVPMCNYDLKVSLWGPPNRVTFSFGKTDVWDRRVFQEKDLTLAQLREICFNPAYENKPFSDTNPFYDSSNAYPFPVIKPVGQLILMVPGMEDAAAITTTRQLGDGVVSIPLDSGKVSGRVEALTMMTRNVFALRGNITKAAEPLKVRIYRHQDSIKPGENVNGYTGKFETLLGFDFSKDAPRNGPIAPPEVYQDGNYFWITQAMPPEKTFPDGFHYIFMTTVVPAVGSIETVSGQKGLGTPPFMTPDREKHTYPGTDTISPMFWIPYEGIREAPGVAATAVLPEASWTVLATVVTSAESSDPLAQARKNLEEAAASGWDSLVAENASWNRKFLDFREDGRIYFEDESRNADALKETLASWSAAHAGFTRPDPRKLQMDRAYAYMESDWSPWHSDVHLNEPNYTNLAVQNQVDRLIQWYGVGEETLPAARRTARAMFGHDGAFFPLAYVPIRTELNWNTNINWMYGMELGAQLAKMFWDNYDYTGDETFLRERAWPILEAVARFYADFLTEGPDGQLHVFPTVAQEYYGLTYRWEKNLDSISALSFIRSHLTTAARSAEILGKATPEEIAKWRSMAERIAPYPTAQTEKGTIYVKVPGEEPGHPTGNLIPQAFPVSFADEITLDSRGEQRGIMERTLGTITGWGGRNEAEVLLGKKKDLSAEALLNSRSGRLHLFPAATRGVNVGFRKLLARGAFEVSAERVWGKVSPILVTSRLGNDLRLANPWPGSDVEAHDLTENQAAKLLDDPDFPAGFLLKTRPGHEYRIGPKQTGSTPLAPREH